MKILVVSEPRSNSSYFLEILSNFYEIPILGNELNDIPKLSWQPWITSKEQPPIPKDYYTSIKNYLENYNNTTDGVIKLHPAQLTFIPHNGIVIDFDLFNFKQYDKIYFTSRMNVLDSISSVLVAETLKTYIYTSPEEVYTSDEIPPITLTSTSTNAYVVQAHIYNNLIIKHLKEYFTSNGLEFEDLYYENILDYVSINFPDTPCSHVKTNYNYKNIITNYDDIIKIYKLHVQKVTAKFYEINTQFSPTSNSALT